MDLKQPNMKNKFSKLQDTNKIRNINRIYVHYEHTI